MFIPLRINNLEGVYGYSSPLTINGLMRKYIIRRLLLGLVVLFGVILITFSITRVLPADPAQKWAGPKATQEQIQAAAIELNLDKPVHIQFGNYVIDLLHGDLGKSYMSRRPVMDELTEAIPATIELVLMATIISVFIGIVLGVSAAKYKNRWPDHIIRFFTIGGVSLPSFWFALALQLLFYGMLSWLPLGGRVSVEISIFYEIPDITGLLLVDSLITGNLVIFKDALWHLILPVIPMTFYPAGLVARMTRSALLEILNEDYITAEKSYGISERFILWVYAFKNSLGPTVTVVTLGLGYTIVNTFLIESIFSWPGIGRYVANAVTNLDYPAIMGVTIFSAIVYLILNLIADLIIALDPRIRIGG